MSLSESLPDRLFLLAYDTHRKRLARWTDVGLLVRAAALAELELLGALVDERGRATLPRMKRPAVADPLLREVLTEIKAAPRPRRWQHWVQRGKGRARTAVERRLVADRVITAQPYRLLGVIPRTRITVRDPRLVERLHAVVAEVLRGHTVDPRDAAMVALAATGELRTVFGWRKRRAHRARIAELAATSSAAAVRGLKKAVAAQHAAEGG